MHKLALTGLAILIGSFVAGCGSSSSGTGPVPGTQTTGPIDGCKYAEEDHRNIDGTDTLLQCDEYSLNLPASQCQSSYPPDSQNKNIRYTQRVAACPISGRRYSCTRYYNGNKAFSATSFYYIEPLNDPLILCDGGVWTKL